ncbi:MAG: hypothetical protein QMD80_04365 [archaeon]|nr:hypothetical protein [archaeon]
MDEIEQLIYEHRQSLKNEVEAEINQMIANELVRLFPMTHGGMDKTHIVWSRALRDTLWLGWLSEALYYKKYNTLMQIEHIPDSFLLKLMLLLMQN